MNANFKIRKVTGYDPGYPVGCRRPGRLEARPLKFLFLVVGFLFFFAGFGCNGTGSETDKSPVYDDQLGGVDTAPGFDYEYDTVDLEVEVPDYDDYELSDVDETVPIYDDEYIPFDNEDNVQLDGLPLPDMVDIDVAETPDDDELLSDSGQTGGDELLSDTDEQLTGFAGPDEIFCKK